MACFYPERIDFDSTAQRAMKIISCEFHLFIFQYPISNTEYPIINSTSFSSKNNHEEHEGHEEISTY